MGSQSRLRRNRHSAGQFLARGAAEIDNARIRTVGHGANDITQSGLLVNGLPVNGHVVLDQHARVLNSGPDDGDKGGDGDTGYRDDGEDGEFAKVSLERELDGCSGRDEEYERGCREEIP
jgi:hypothetical protein